MVYDPQKSGAVKYDRGQEKCGGGSLAVGAFLQRGSTPHPSSLPSLPSFPSCYSPSTSDILQYATFAHLTAPHAVGIGCYLHMVSVSLTTRKKIETMMDYCPSDLKVLGSNPTLMGCFVKAIHMDSQST